MLDNYLKKGETIESRLDELLNDARASGNPTLNTVRFAEAQVLATILATPATIEPAVYNMSMNGEPAYTPDEVATALDEAFEGRQAPTALKGAVLALLAEEATHDTLGAFVVSDSSLVPDDADGKSAMVEGEGHPYIDAGVDLDETIPDHNAEEEMADRMADDFPEFAQPEADPLEATTTKKTKKGGKKTAAQRAAEEAGL